MTVCLFPCLARRYRGVTVSLFLCLAQRYTGVTVSLFPCLARRYTGVTVSLFCVTAANLATAGEFCSASVMSQQKVKVIFKSCVRSNASEVIYNTQVLVPNYRVSLFTSDASYGFPSISSARLPVNRSND